ncbi:MAG: hypothetical protein JXR97_00380, partial [Planctomycetes bacterium]|nr:hypothetical protein [Planctomycetota bacterium]
LYVDGKPFTVKGVTFGVPDEDTAKLEEAFKDLKFLGVNAIRNWGVGKGTKNLLDAADRQGIKVCLGIWLRHGREGAEGSDNFNWISDEAGRKAQWDGAIEAVKKFKDHPAILMWGLGNEVVLNLGSEEEKVAYAKFLGKLSTEIKKIDPNHPCASAGAWSIPWKYWKEYCPDLDVYGVNTYGPGVQVLDKEQEKLGVTKPYLLTEYGSRGNWDAPKDANGAIIDPTDQEKFDAVAKAWKEWIEPKPGCIGAFIFHYSDFHNAVGVWQATRVMGYKRPTYWGIYKAYTGKDPVNDYPKISKFSIRKDAAQVGDWLATDLAVTDKENDKLTVEFWCNQKDSSYKDGWKMIKLETKGSLADGFQVKVPDKKGVIKIYVYVLDEAKNMAAASRSVAIMTKEQIETGNKAGQKAELPFYVYNDEGSADNHYVGSGMMGDFNAMKIDYKCTDNPQSGDSCIKFNYTKGDGWFGMAWQDPHNDWGTKYGGYDFSGAKAFSFWARGEQGGEKIKCGFGLISRDKTWFDTAKADTGDVILTKEWKQYTISLEGRNMTRIKTGMTIFFGGSGKPFTFYIDGIKYE